MWLRPTAAGAGGGRRGQPTRSGTTESGSAVARSVTAVHVLTSHRRGDQLARPGGSTTSLIVRNARGSSRCATSLRRWSCSSPSLLSVVPRDSRLKIRFSATPSPETNVLSSRSTALHSA